MGVGIGICEWSLPVSGTFAIQIAAEAGCGCIQIGECGGRKAAFPLNEERVQALYLETAEEAGIELHSLNLGALLEEGTLNFPEESAEGQNARESLRKGFEAARALGLDAVVVTAEPRSRGELENAAAHLRYAAELSNESGSELAIEFGVGLEAMERILSAPGLERAKLCMDSLNPARFGVGDALEQIKYFGIEKISHFHFKDCPKELLKKGERGNCALGEGAGRVDELISLVKTMGYDGRAISENRYFLPPLNDAEGSFIELAVRDIEYMKKGFENG